MRKKVLEKMMMIEQLKDNLEDVLMHLFAANFLIKKYLDLYPEDVHVLNEALDDIDASRTKLKGLRDMKQIEA